MTGEDLRDDPEAQFEFLVEQGAIRERDDGTVVITEAFDAVRGVYHDTYANCTQDVFEETVASLFGLPVEDAAERIAERGVERGELVAYLSLRSYLDDAAPEADLGQGVLLRMAGMVAGVSPESPVPEAMAELDDDDYASFIEAEGDAVVFVWKLHCEPCDVMKRELGAIVDAVPEGVAVAGVDGGTVAEFRREFDVDAAPATLTFAGGELVEVVTGRRSADQLAEMFANAYSSPSTA